MTIVTKKSVGLALIAVGVMISSLAIAATSKVAGGMHDFSASGASPQYHDSGNELNQVCVYCHTPHNAGKTRLLWNKATNGNVNFRLYTSSGTLSSVTRNSSALTSDSPSLVCLGCHDGKTAMNVLHSSGKGITAAAAGLTGYPVGSDLAFGNTALVIQNPYVFGDPQPGPALGGGAGDDLTNDHPIGFSYTGAQTEKTGASLRPIGDALLDARIKFFGAAKKVECSTCHDPHVDNAANPTQSPFLVMPNTGSALCLACHNK